MKTSNNQNIAISKLLFSSCLHAHRGAPLHPFTEAVSERIIEFAERIKWILSSFSAAPHPSLLQVLLVEEGFALHELVMDQNNSNSEKKCVEVYSWWCWEQCRASALIETRKSRMMGCFLWSLWNLNLAWNAPHTKLFRDVYCPTESETAVNHISYCLLMHCKVISSWRAFWQSWPCRSGSFYNCNTHQWLNRWLSESTEWWIEKKYFQNSPFSPLCWTESLPKSSSSDRWSSQPNTVSAVYSKWTCVWNIIPLLRFWIHSLDSDCFSDR